MPFLSSTADAKRVEKYVRTELKNLATLKSGDLVEVLPGHRLDSPLAYWLVVGPRSGQRPEIQAFCAWLLLQAETTRRAIGEETPAATAGSP